MNIGNIEASREELYMEINKKEKQLLPYEKWILSRLTGIIEKMTNSMENYSFSHNGLDLISFIRDDFSDFAIEAYKIEKDNSPLGKSVLSIVALEILVMMHPYIPHITETLYGHITGGKILATEYWSKIMRKQDIIIEENIEKISQIVRTIRNIRAEKNIKPGELKDVWIIGKDFHTSLLEENASLLTGLAKINTLTIGQKPEDTKNLAYGIAHDVEIYVDAQVDSSALEAEKERILAQIADKKEYLRGINAKLSNPSFAKNAPEKIVRAEMEKRRQAEEQLQKFEEKLANLGI